MQGVWDNVIQECWKAISCTVLNTNCESERLVFKKQQHSQAIAAEDVKHNNKKLFLFLFCYFSNIVLWATV